MVPDLRIGGTARDSLTGLPTREVLLEQLRAALGRLERRTGLVAVAFIDLDRMKAVNDSLGHHAGDLMLCDIAVRLRATVRGGDSVARFGGDEFVVLLQDVTSQAEVENVVRRLQGVIEQPLLSGGHRLEASASIGFAVAGAGESSAEQLIREADAAMYDAKRSGRGPVRFDERLRQRADERVRMESELRQGLESGEVRAHFQPIVRMDGEVVGAEALARWHHPEHGLMLPGVFVPLAEETGLIHSLGTAMLRDACAAVRQWRAQVGRESIYATVNLSARQIARPGLVGEFLQTLDAHSLTPDALLIEVTETVLVSDAELAHAVLTQAADSGIRVALDDFGTGYSSLTHLRDFPVDVVKIDQSFVAAMLGNPTDMAIVQALIDLCGALGVLVCAEGVEHRGQAEALADLGCPLAQGELWSGAVPADAFLRLVEEPSP